MPSTDSDTTSKVDTPPTGDTPLAGDTGLDPETEAAIRRVVREELAERDSDTDAREAVRAVTQVAGGLVAGWLGLSVVAGGLIAVDAPVAPAAALVVAALGLAVAYGWRLPPFR